MVSQNRKADPVGVVHAGFDVVSAALTDRIAAARPQAAIDLVDAGFELHADFLKPFDALRNVFTQCGDKSRVGAEIARSHRLFGMELRRVLNACFLVICFYGRIQAASANHSIAAWNGKFFQKLPVVALTANAIGGAREMFLAEGFQDFVAKPVEVSVLEHVLKKYIPSERIIVQTEEEIGKETEKNNKKESDVVIKAADSLEGLIDIQTGINYSGGVYEDYIDVIRLYYNSGVEKKQQMQKLFEDKDWNDYTIMVHALKSTSLGIGAKELSEMAKEQEKAGKENNTEYLLAHHNLLMETYATVLDAIAGNKDFFPDNEDKSLEKLKELSWEELKEKLDKLSEALDTFEEEAVIPVINDLSLYLYKGSKIAGKLDGLKGLVNSFDFCGAADILEELRKEWEDA